MKYLAAVILSFFFLGVNAQRDCDSITHNLKLKDGLLRDDIYDSTEFEFSIQNKDVLKKYPGYTFMAGVKNGKIVSYYAAEDGIEAMQNKKVMLSERVMARFDFLMVSDSILAVEVSYEIYGTEVAKLPWEIQDGLFASMSRYYFNGKNEICSSHLGYRDNNKVPTAQLIKDFADLLKLAKKELAQEENKKGFVKAVNR